MDDNEVDQPDKPDHLLENFIELIKLHGAESQQAVDYIGQYHHDVYTLEALETIRDLKGEIESGLQ